MHLVVRGFTRRGKIGRLFLEPCYARFSEPAVPRLRRNGSVTPVEFIDSLCQLRRIATTTIASVSETAEFFLGARRSVCIGRALVYGRVCSFVIVIPKVFGRNARQ